MKTRTLILCIVLSLLGVPAMLAAIEAVSYHVHNRSNRTIVSSGQRREYLLYVPKRYDRAKPTPLVISLHAAALWGAAQKETSQWNRVADAHGFIVVYPSATKDRGPRIWDHERGPMKDVTFISDLIDTLEAAYNIDPARIYANGLSNGGGMSFVLSCTLSDRIAAVGMVGAAQLLPWTWCADHRPFPMITFHGTADPQVPYAGGKSWAAPVRFPNVPAWVAAWATQRNRCAPDAMDSVVAPDVVRRTYGECADHADAVLYTIKGGGHTWPGGTPLAEWFVGSTTRSIDASSLMWEFFREHPLTSARR